MTVQRYDAAMAPALAASYNELVRGLPYCYPVSAQQLAAAAAGEPSEERLHSDAVFAAMQSDAVRGIAHVAMERSDRLNTGARGVIRFLWYERGHRAAGQALLQAAESHLRAQGARTVIAFHQDYRYPFYHIGHAYLSDRLEHVHALLGMNGYRRCAGEVYLRWPDYRPPTPGEPPLPVEVRLEWPAGRGELPGLVVHALRDGEQVGVCVNVSLGEFTAAPAAQRAFLTKWLGVEAPVQGIGLGRFLLATALGELHGAGYRDAVISTSWTNHRACLFYSNFGYRADDWTYALARDLA
ncbi:MAG: GNAT family N-acetyltransferase [Armatimonadota bacterium]